MNNTVANSAIAQINKDKAAQASDQARAKIQYILKEQATIKQLEAGIKALQEEQSKISLQSLKDTDVLGRQFSPLPNSNELAIMKAISDHNESTAKAVEAQAKGVISAIDSRLGSIKACNDRIAALRKEMEDIVADVVTAEQVLG